METVIRNVSYGSGRLEKISEKGKSLRARSHRPISHRVVLMMTQMGGLFALAAEWFLDLVAILNSNA